MIELQATDLKTKRNYEMQRKQAELDKEFSIANLGAELAKEKVKSMNKDIDLRNLGSEVAKLKIEIMHLKGGVE